MDRFEKVLEEPSGLEQMIGAVRKELWVFYDQYKGYQQKVLEVVETGKAHSECKCKLQTGYCNYYEVYATEDQGGVILLKSQC
jgi:hypothetical protein